MSAQTATCLILYGNLIIALGLGSVWLSQPVAEISLLLGSTSGALAVLCGVLGAPGCRRNLLLALPGGVVAALCFAWQSGLGWLAVWEGTPGKLLESSLLTLLLAASIPMLAALLKAIKASDKKKAAVPRKTVPT
jgi:hypothetical protein